MDARAARDLVEQEWLLGDSYTHGVGSPVDTLAGWAFT
jgi:hypothetical protein